jgi:hypothetical protein
MRHALAIRVISVEFEADSQSTEGRLALVLLSRLVDSDPTAAGKENGQQQALRVPQAVRRHKPSGASLIRKRHISHLTFPWQSSSRINTKNISHSPQSGQRALNRHVVREFDPSRKDTHWGKGS